MDAPTCACAGEDGPCWGTIEREFSDGESFCSGHCGRDLNDRHYYRPDPITLAGARAWWDACRHLRDDPVAAGRAVEAGVAHPDFLPPWDATRVPLAQADAATVTEALFAVDRLRAEGMPRDAEPADFAAWAVVRDREEQGRRVGRWKSYIGSDVMVGYDDARRPRSGAIRDLALYGVAVEERIVDPATGAGRIPARGLW
jgi:hypothetical protein